jgi:hypothetical protein
MTQEGAHSPIVAHTTHTHTIRWCAPCVPPPPPLPPPCTLTHPRTRAPLHTDHGPAAPRPYSKPPVFPAASVHAANVMAALKSSSAQHRSGVESSSCSSSASASEAGSAVATPATSPRIARRVSAAAGNPSPRTMDLSSSRCVSLSTPPVNRRSSSESCDSVSVDVSPDDISRMKKNNSDDADDTGGATGTFPS